MSINVHNIEQAILDKMNSSSTELELLEYSKMLTELKTGIVQVVDTFASLPTASESVGHLYYVQYEKTVYWANAANGWITLEAQEVNLIFSMGINTAGQLANGTLSNNCSPVQEFCSAANWSTFSIGYCHGAALKRDNTIWSWGVGPHGNSTSGVQCSPVGPVFQGPTWCSVNAGRDRTLALGTDGSLWGWGLGAGGALAQNNVTNYCSPIREITSSTWIQASTGWYQTSQGVKSDGTFWSWGRDNYGMLGKNTKSLDTCTPVQEITSSTTWCTGDVGFYNNGGIKTDGTLWAWGVGFYGASFSALSSSSPVQESGSATDWCKMVWSGGNSPYTGFVLKTNGTLWAWGYSGYGTRGDGTTSDTSVPIQEITSSTNWCGIGAGVESGRGIKTDGTVWSWGKQTCGEFGRYDEAPNICYSSPIQELTSSTS